MQFTRNAPRHDTFSPVASHHAPRTAVFSALHESTRGAHRITAPQVPGQNYQQQPTVEPFWRLILNLARDH